MPRERHVELSSDLKAEPHEVLAHIATLDGANEELRPWLEMTVPPSYRSRSLFDAPIGEPLFRSWLLLGGVLPIDFDHIALESADPASGFQESSTMLSMRSWRHERRVVPIAPGRSRLSDRLAFVPRLPGTGWLLSHVVRLLFEHRHQRLRTRFGHG